MVIFSIKKLKLMKKKCIYKKKFINKNIVNIVNNIVNFFLSLKKEKVTITNIIKKNNAVNLDKRATKIKKLLNHIKKIEYPKLFMLKFSWFLNKLKEIPATIK
jgi:hypothetical protein